MNNNSSDITSNEQFSKYFELYEPREDSYLLQKYVQIYTKKGILFLDMGTGSGIQGITALKKKAKVVSIDINKKAIQYAKENAKKELNEKELKNIKFIESDLFKKIPKEYKNKFDIIAFNPPYLPKERILKKEDENIALYSAKRGCETTLRFLENANEYLKEDGFILLIGSSLASWSLLEESLKKNLFDYEILEKIHIFFEDIFILKIKKSEILKKLEKLKIKNPKLFAKGKRGLIIKGLLKNKKILKNKNKKEVAIKIKRKDSEAKNTIENETKFLKILNKHKIGPKLILSKKDFLIYEFVKGEFIFDFIMEKTKKEIILVLKKIFKQLFILDKLKINKFEMHHPHKHIIIEEKISRKKETYNPVLIDFERARFSNDTKNITQFCDFLIGEDLNKILKEKNIIIHKEKIIEMAKNYKHNKTKKNFYELLKYLSMI
ncbi:MAG: methyltransferase domain-containing protein [Candidatus Woesearchaeota archaeon]